MNGNDMFTQVNGFVLSWQVMLKALAKKGLTTYAGTLTYAISEGYQWLTAYNASKATLGGYCALCIRNIEIMQDVYPKMYYGNAEMSDYAGQWMDAETATRVIGTYQGMIAMQGDTVIQVAQRDYQAGMMDKENK